MGYLIRLAGIFSLNSSGLITSKSQFLMFFSVAIGIDQLFFPGLGGGVVAVEAGAAGVLAGTGFLNSAREIAFL